MDLGEIIIAIIIIADIVFLITLLFTEKGNPSKIVAWGVVFLVLPVVGFIAYLFIGQTFYAKHTFRIKGLEDDQIEKVHNYDSKHVENEPVPEYKGIAQSLQRLGGFGYTDKNNVQLFTLGEDKFKAFYDDLRAAKKCIHIEYYIIRNDELGNELMSILIEKVKEGVDVKLLTDDFGVGKGPKKAIKEYEKVGGQFALFHKVFTLMFSPKKNNRNHRKLAVIDGEIAYCGGFNIGDEYLGKGPLGFWRDTAVRITGPGVFPLHVRFQMDWEYASKKPMEEYLLDLYKDANVDQSGDVRLMTISGGPDVAEFNPVRMQYLELINRSTKTLYMHTPYFIPHDTLRDALTLAAARGVDVKVIIPDKPDHLFVFWNNISSAYDLMKNGVKFYMYNRGFVHSKSMVADGEYCSVGSANFDDRSLVLNFETNQLILSKEIGKQMDEAFEEDLKYCTEYTMKDYESLSLISRIRIAISRLFENLA
ncbi:MAG: cardiolipin synthase [Candidatus Methanomethylophilaceae archaeon]|nr:cardiolipin synthase [Candidatus Methanomethylophilaceae archaeon]